ncbi:uncharacterized protein J3D65DRAFT_675134 [Phyllosticta citribraziliensis]|uniref:Proteophosphoglycan ppg4 n=1 Tax=Phyllosticta citribraziliensis TaxID=989973 RepID=A0ABR1M0F9_9PEZI
MSSSAPQQPPTAAAYAQSNNPVSRNPAESSTSTSGTNTNTNTTTEAHRTASSAPSTGIPTSLARGVHGTAAEAGADKAASEVGAGQDDAEQMAAPGEGAVADAVVDGQGKSGAAGAGGLGTEEDLGRKKAEQAPLREAVKQERKHDVDVGGVLGQRGGPANPVH